MKQVVYFTRRHNGNNCFIILLHLFDTFIFCSVEHCWNANKNDTNHMKLLNLLSMQKKHSQAHFQHLYMCGQK